MMQQKENMKLKMDAGYDFLIENLEIELGLLARTKKAEFKEIDRNRVESKMEG